MMRISRMVLFVFLFVCYGSIGAMGGDVLQIPVLSSLNSYQSKDNVQGQSDGYVKRGAKLFAKNVFDQIGSQYLFSQVQPVVYLKDGDNEIVKGFINNAWTFALSKQGLWNNGLAYETGATVVSALSDKVLYGEGALEQCSKNLLTNLIASSMYACLSQKTKNYCINSLSKNPARWWGLGAQSLENLVIKPHIASHIAELLMAPIPEFPAGKEEEIHQSAVNHAGVFILAGSALGTSRICNTYLASQNSSLPIEIGLLGTGLTAAGVAGYRIGKLHAIEDAHNKLMELDCRLKKKEGLKHNFSMNDIHSFKLSGFDCLC